MPEYVYECERCGKTKEVVHSIAECDTIKIACLLPSSDTPAWIACNGTMRRVPQPFSVNWNGVKPSGGAPHPSVQNLIDTAPERKDKFLERHEAHEKATAHEGAKNV